MLKKLRRKFIFINMALIGAVLLCVFAAVVTSSYQNLKSDIWHSLDLAVQLSDGHAGKPGGNPGRGGAVQTLPEPKLIAVYAVLADESGGVMYTYQSYPSMEEGLLKSAVARAVDSDQERGIFRDVSLYYVRQKTAKGVVVALTDAGYLTISMRQLLLSSLLIGAGGLVAFFLISLFLSHWALRPVEEAWNRQRQFIADASHELKTPLTVIMANNNILLSHPEETVASQRGWVESTGEEADYMHRLINDLLFLAQSDASTGRERQAFSTLDLSELCWGVLLQFEPVAYEKQVYMEADIPEKVMLEGNPTQMKQLIHILLDNACKYAGENGRVLLRLAMKSGMVRLSVQNSGSPIPKEDLPHIFQRFYRSDRARGREGGFGLGLSIAKSIVENHGGTITAKSEPGVGTVFIVVFGPSKKKSASL